MNGLRRALALFLCFALCFSLLPLSAFAEGAEDEEEQIEELLESEDLETPEEGDDGDGDGEACVHVPAGAVTENTAAPTCTAPGSHDEVVYCSLCGEELERTTVEDPACHTPAEPVRENELEPTQTAPGSHDEVVYCALCGQELSRETVEDPAEGQPEEDTDALTAENEELPEAEDELAQADWLTADGATKEVGSWEQLHTALRSNGTVKLTQDITSPVSDFEIPSGVTVTLDLNGYILTDVLAVGGKLTLTDSQPTTAHPSTEIKGGVIIGSILVASDYDDWEGSYTYKGTLTMNGGTISGIEEDVDFGGGVSVQKGTFTMNGGAISGNSADFAGGGVFVHEGTFTMNGGTISENSADNGGGVWVDGWDAVFTMTGGTISGNSASFGGGVWITNATFTMTGGEISDNVGGGIYAEGGSFTMTGGEVSGNSSKNYGGIAVAGASFTMKDGIISGNSDSGVVIMGGSFTMTGGEISGNSTAEYGGGVSVGQGWLDDDGFTMTGGTISGNSAGTAGGGVYVADGAVFRVSGQPVITNNTAGDTNTANNVYLTSGQMIAVTGRLTNKVPIGVTTEVSPTLEQAVVFTDGLPRRGTTACFASDLGYAVLLSAAGEAQLSRSSLWAELQAMLSAGGTVTLTKDYTAEPDDVVLVVPSDVDVDLDLNGHRIDRGPMDAETDGFVIRVEGVLNLNDSSSAKTGVITGGKNAVHRNGSSETESLTGGGVFVSGSFTMYGGSISGNRGLYGGVTIDNGGSFTMYGGSITDNITRMRSLSDRSGWAGGVNVGGIFAMYGGTISNNDGLCGGVSVDDGGDFVMYDGTISANTAHGITQEGGGCGGGVFVSDEGSFTMNGGRITGNRTVYRGWGAGVFAYDNFTMNGGTISGNYHKHGGYGGGVYIIGGDFTMNGGEISSNSATGGGGVLVNRSYTGGAYYYACFNLSGTPKIIDNSATEKCGGVYIISDCSFNVSGAPVITGNTAGGADAASNVCLPSGGTITVNGALTNTAFIGVTTESEPTAGQPVVITSGLPGNGTAANFTGDDPTFVVRPNAAGECELAVPPQSAPPAALTLSSTYLALTQGQTAQLAVSEGLGDWASYVSWFSDDPGVAAVDQNGLVTASENSTGTARITASVDVGGSKLSASCRVDVVDGAVATNIANMRLMDTAATTELYSTDYTCITVIPVLEQNQQYAQAFTDVLTPDGSAQEPEGAVESAVFADRTNTGINGFFELRVVDDRTLEIVPQEAALTNAKDVKGSYTAAILVKVKGQQDSFETAPLKLTVKKSQPKVTVKVDKLNSFIPGDTKPLIFTGAAAKSAVPDPEKATLQPDWLTYDKNTFTVTLKGNALNQSKSGKLYLLVEPEGWNVELPVTVSVSAAKTAPKLTLKPTSLSLYPGVGDSASATATITPAELADTELEVVSITEGSTVYLNNKVLLVEIDGQTVTVREGATPQKDGKAHTYKVNISAGGEKPVTLTVKLLAANTATLTAKASGSIDLAVRNCPVILVPTLKNYSGPVNYRITKIFDAAGSEVPDGVFNTSRLQITAAGSPATGNYKAELTAEFANGKTKSVTVPFTVKRSAKAPEASVTLKAAGGIDVIRPGTSAILTPTVKNMYGWTLSANNVVITRTYNGQTKKACSEPATGFFTVSIADGQFIVRAKQGVSHLDKFTATATIGGIASKPVSLTLKMGSAKITQSVKTVTLLADDCNDRAVVKLTAEDPTLSAIDRVELDSPKDKNKRAIFALTDLGGGEYAIGYNESLLPVNFKSGTAKLNVFLKGNNSAKPNATLSVSVKLG